MIRFRLMVAALKRVFLCLSVTTIIVIIIFHKYVTHDRYRYEYDEIKGEIGAVDMKVHNILDYDIREIPLSKLPVLKNYDGNIILPEDPPCLFRYPRLKDIRFSNVHWQILHTGTALGNFVYLFAAYYDNRPLVATRGPLVRITVMIDRTSPPNVYCQLWITRKENPVVVKAFFKLLWPKTWGNFKDGFFIPHLVTCKIPLNISRVPITVSLVENPCDPATNSLRVFNERRDKDLPRPSFAVCVKSLSYYDTDISVRLVEWLELLRILGASKVFMYNLAVHPNIDRVLKHYQRTNFVKVKKISFPGPQPNDPELVKQYQEENIVNKRQHEMIPYNDCLYRQIHVYDYISTLDVDEILLPVEKDLYSWKQILEWVPDISPDTICARHVYFFNEWEATDSPLPRYLYMLNHVLRSANYTTPTQYVKCFHNTQQVVAVHNHFPMACANPRYCIAHMLDKKTAQLQHYRNGCTLHLSKQQCDLFKSKAVLDVGIRRYYNKLESKVETILQQLDFF